VVLWVRLMAPLGGPFFNIMLTSRA
jgi:hypothetical protein